MCGLDAARKTESIPQKTKKLFDELNELENIKMKTLSMGMSGDYQIAIREGSTSIRVGTAIFGPRG